MKILSKHLYIVSTPIGNLDDITFRALEVLKNSDIILCEDTRRSIKLLSHYKIKKKLISYNNFNEKSKYEHVLKIINDGSNVALVSDAGTPCISDPGYRLVNSALKKNINVISLPGSCSAIAALSISGLPSDKFYFEGFLPKKKGFNKRVNFLKNLDATIIIFESPKRIVKTLNKIFDLTGDRVISICKEISKIHEKTYFGLMSNVIEELSNLKSIKGEFIIMIAKKGYDL